MDRIFKYWRAKKRKVSIQPLTGGQTDCSFCGQSLTKSHLNAASQSDNSAGTGPLAIICSRCIDRLAKLSTLCWWYQRFYRRENLWPDLHDLISMRLRAQRGSEPLRAVVANLLVRLAQRAFSIVAGHRANGLEFCPRTHIPLGASRIVLVSAEPNACVRMVLEGAAAFGLPVLEATDEEARTGRAIGDLKKDRCNYDPLILQTAALVLCDFVAIHDDVVVVYVLSTADDLPDDLEVIVVPDRGCR